VSGKTAVEFGVTLQYAFLLLSPRMCIATIYTIRHIL